MLLVDHDQPDVVERREHRRSRPDAHARLAAAQPQPLVAALAPTEAGVEHRDDVAEPGLEPSHGLRRERDLGHQDDRGPPGRERGLDRLEVHLGLARAGHAVEQEPPPGALIAAQSGQDRVQRVALLARQLRHAIEAAPHGPDDRPRHPVHRREPDQPTRFEAAQCVPPLRLDRGGSLAL